MQWSIISSINSSRCNGSSGSVCAIKSLIHQQFNINVKTKKKTEASKKVLESSGLPIFLTVDCGRSLVWVVYGSPPNSS